MTTPDDVRDDVRPELDAMRKVFDVLTPLDRATRCRVLLMVVLSQTPMLLTYEQQRNLLRIANSAPPNEPDPSPLLNGICSKCGAACLDVGETPIICGACVLLRPPSDV